MYSFSLAIVGEKKGNNVGAIFPPPLLGDWKSNNAGKPSQQYFNYLVDEIYRNASKITVVHDQLNTHVPSSLH